MRHKVLLTCPHILDFHLRPFISIKKRHARAQIFGRLELPGDFGWRERVIDAVAAVAQLLDLGARIALLYGDEWPQVKVKNMTTGEQELVSHENLAADVDARLR